MSQPIRGSLTREQMQQAEWVLARMCEPHLARLRADPEAVTPDWTERGNSTSRATRNLSGDKLRPRRKAARKAPTKSPRNAAGKFKPPQQPL